MVKTGDEFYFINTKGKKLREVKSHEEEEERKMKSEK
jgi:hypothetical protein